MISLGNSDKEQGHTLLIWRRRIFTKMDGEQTTFSGISAQDNVMAVQEAKAWIEVSLCTFVSKNI